MKRIYILILSFIPLLALSQEKINPDKIQKILDKAIDEKNVFGMVVSINEGVIFLALELET